MELRIRVTPEFLNRLDAYCDHNHVDRSSVTRLAVTEYLDRRQLPEKEVDSLESLFGMSAQRLHNKWMTTDISKLIELRKRMYRKGYGHTDTYRFLKQHINARRHCERVGKEMNNPFADGSVCPECRGVIGCNDTSCSKCGHKVI